MSNMQTLLPATRRTQPWKESFSPYQGIVKDARGQVIWECPIARSHDTQAFADACEAVEELLA